MIEMLLSTVLEGKEELEQSDQGFSVPPECNQSKLSTAHWSFEWIFSYRR